MPEPDRGSAKWLRVAAIVGVLVLAFIGARGCQQAEVRITKEQAIATAEEQVRFAPGETQVRLLRQGIDRRPFWFVSLAVTSDRDPDVFTRLAVVKINANNGKVESIDEDSVRDEEAKEAVRGEGEGAGAETAP